MDVIIVHKSSFMMISRQKDTMKLIEQPDRTVREKSSDIK